LKITQKEDKKQTKRLEFLVFIRAKNSPLRRYRMLFLIFFLRRWFQIEIMASNRNQRKQCFERLRQLRSVPFEQCSKCAKPIFVACMRKTSLRIYLAFCAHALPLPASAPIRTHV